MSKSISYRVIATVAKDAIEEYNDWLEHGHVQEVLKYGGTSVEVSVVETLDSNATHIKIVSDYEFPSREKLQHYFDVGAPVVREDIKTRFIEPKKVILVEREIAEIIFKYKQ